MKHVSINSIVKATQKVDRLSDDEFETVAQNMLKGQPILFDFVHMMSENHSDVKLDGYLFYYFALIMEAFRIENIAISQIDEAIIDDAYEDFIQTFDEFLESENLEILEEYTDQPYLIQFMMTEISTPDEDGTEMSDELAMAVLMVMTAVIYLLSKSIKS